MQSEHNDGSFDEPIEFNEKMMMKELGKEDVKEVHVFNIGKCPTCGKRINEGEEVEKFYCSTECHKARNIRKNKLKKDLKRKRKQSRKK